jgi:rubrerythrin
MPERFVLRGHFTEMLQAARTAADKYDRLARTAESPAAREQLQRLARDESRHVELAERLLEILSE